ncbi:MAG: DUF4097 domain-containing protein [Ruminococcaceae bacterium]|nr:DUF4097 domain-containing protein [Oscillospiraceae bacterium]
MKKIKFNFKPSVSLFVLLFAVIIFSLMCLSAYNMGKESSFGLNEFAERTYEYGDTQSVKIIDSLVEDITVNWHRGDVQIIKRAGTSTRIYEKASEELGEDQHMSVTVEGTEVTVNWNEDGAGLNKELGKCLVIEVPLEKTLYSLTVNAGNSGVYLDGCDSYDLSVNTGYGNVQFKKIESEEVYFKTVKGAVIGENCDFESLKVRSTDGRIKLNGCNVYGLDLYSGTGEISFEGDFASLKAKTFSGNISAETTYKPKDINVSTTNGNILLDLPSNISAKGEYKTVSGEFITDFTFKDKGENIIAISSEENELNLASSSGNITLNKGEKSVENTYFKKVLGKDEEE